MNKYQEALYEVIRLCAQSEETFPTEEIEILQELTDKATPKKPVKMAMPGFDEEIASELCCCGCNMPIVNVWTRREYKPRYCHYCGQALDWSGKNGD